MAKVLKADGSWYEGKAAPELLEPHMRGLPGELATKEVAEGEKVHKLDPSHVRETIISDHKKKIEDSEKKNQVLEVDALKAILHSLPSEIAHGREIKFEEVAKPQWEIDLIRTRVCFNMFMLVVKYDMPDRLKKTYHLWFPKNNINLYEFREGNAPSKFDRPYYLKKCTLFLDLLNWPESVLNFLRYKLNVEVDMGLEYLKGALQ